MTALYLDDRFLKHDTGDHPECAARLDAVHARLRAGDLLDRVTRRTPEIASDVDLERVHGQAYLKSVQEFATAGGGRIEADTEVSEESDRIARLAAGAVIDAVEHVIAGNDTQALCLTRPPGHHALPDSAMGFCLINNVAVGARCAVERLGLSRVLIVDWDVHHGNGTQDIVYEDAAITYFSAHRFPFYPGTGRRSETGRGAGLGTIFNLPVEFGISRADYRSAFENELTKAADRCRPDLVLLSAGFDAHADDPIGSLGLETEDFAGLTRLVQQVAATHAGGRLVSVLEGGYNVDRLADCVELHLETMIAGR